MLSSCVKSKISKRWKQVFVSIFFLGLAFCGSAFCAPPADPPDHLIPVNPYPSRDERRYRDELTSRLQLEPPNLPPGFFRMIMRPWIPGESAIRLHDGNDEFYFEDAKKLLLTYTVANRNIAAALNARDPAKALGVVQVSTTTVELSAPLATRLHTLWKRMLLRTRYSDPKYRAMVTDGTIFEFGSMLEHGQTSAPGTGKSPNLFIDLGISLMDYCKATPEERPVAERKIVSNAALLEKYLDQHPLK